MKINNLNQAGFSETVSFDGDEIDALIEPVETEALISAPSMDISDIEKRDCQIIITYRTPEEYRDLLDFLGVDGAQSVYEASTLLRKY